MKQGWLKIGYALLASSLLSACVTESTISGTNIPVTKHVFNRDAAARERMQLGLTYLRRGNSQQAKYNLEKAMEYAPDLEEVHIAMAYYYQKVGDSHRAEQSYERAIHSRNVSGDSFNNFGVFLCEQKQYAKSEAMFLKAIEMPKYTRIASSYENLGYCTEQANELIKAQKYFDLALKYDSRRVKSIFELTKIELKLNRLTQAKQRIEQYHKIAVQSPESLELGLNVANKLNDKAMAKNYGISLLAKFPTSPQAKHYRTSMH
ncbi:MAG: type IV pilus biogenesis/stability protein PilW [Parashewanella sp.]